MAGFIRGKQAGIQGDLSASILPGLFAPDDQARFGLNSQIGALAYDPVQSLLAIGTCESSYGAGQIYIFGQKQVQITFYLPRQASVRSLHFSSTRLLCIDSKNEVTVWDLQEKKLAAHYNPPGLVTTIVTDPMLDWAFMGLQTGEIIAYDLDRGKLAPMRIPNFWKRDINPRGRLLSIVSLQLHPRDIGQLLIGYTEGAVIYSFKQDKMMKVFQYELPPGAPGGSADPLENGKIRRPRLTQALWHPTGTFILTTHDDTSMVFWDPKDGRVVMARTLTDNNVDQPGTESKSFGQTPGTYALKEPYSKISWCAKQNPDDTAILIAGGSPTTAREKGLNFLELGVTPVYNTSTWQMLNTHFEGKRKYLLASPDGADVVDYCLIPRASPHYAGAQDPIAVIALLTSGELITLSFPSGHPISPTNQLPPSISFVHPFVISIAVSQVSRPRWLGFVENRQQGPLLLRGGAEANRPLRRYEGRNIIQMAHGDGTIRLWDAGHADEIENSTTLQVDIARSLDSYNVNISSMSMSNSTGEFVVGTASGDVVVFRWDNNKLYGREDSQSVNVKPGGITDISSRAEPSLKEGLQPFIQYNMAQGPITVVKMSEVGFIGIGSQNGGFSIIDMRGPAVILETSINDFGKGEKQRSGFMKRGSTQASPKSDWPVVVSFGVLTVEGDAYSSICCFVGTNQGKVITLKILPQGSGFTAQYSSGIATLADKIISIDPIVADTGKSAIATGPGLSDLRNGVQTNGTLVVVTQTEARIFKPTSAKGAHKSWDNMFCEAAAVTEFELHGYALVGVFGDGTTRAYSLPALKEIGNSRLNMFDKTRISSSIVTSSGDILGWTGPSELAMLNVWCTGQSLPHSQDTLWNPKAIIPSRPTISNLQWISGTQYVSPTDLDLLVGGPDRPPSKRMLAAAAEESRLAKKGGSSRTPDGSQEGWGDYMARQLNERTEKLNIMGDGMDKAADNSQGFLDDVNKFVGKQKRNVLLGGITGKWF